MYTLDALEQSGLRPAVRNHEPKATIFQPGQRPERVYFLLDGTVRIYKEYGLAKEFTSEILHDDGVFGLEAMEGVSRAGSTTSSYGASSVRDRRPGRARRQGAQALADSEIASVSARDLAAAARREPGLLRLLLEEVVESVSRREEAAERLTHREVSPRLACALLSLGETLGIRSGSRIVVEPGFSHEQIAQMTGCTREAISKAIGELRASGIAEVSRSVITIKGPDALTGLTAPGDESRERQPAVLA